MSEDIKDLEKLIELTGKAVSLGIKIGKDGIDATDIKYLGEAESLLKEVYEFVKSKPELVAEVKDVDFSEGIVLLKDIYDQFKKVNE